MFYTVYKITCKTTGKYYIGKHQTKDLDDGYYGSGKLIKRAVNKYGKDAFDKKILFVFESEAEMNEAEAKLVDPSDPLSLNLCPGGYGGFGYINESGKNLYGKNGQPGYGLENLTGDFERTDEYRKKMSESKKAHFEKNGHHWLGRKHTEETKQKMSAVDRTGKKNSQFGTMWITNGVTSKKHKKSDPIPEGYRAGRKMK